MCPSLFLGIFRGASITNDYSFVHWYKQGWRLFRTAKCIFVYLYMPNHHLGGTQHIRLKSDSIPRHNFHMVAGVLFNIYIYFLC